MASIDEALQAGDLDAIEAAILSRWHTFRDPLLGDVYDQFCAFAESERTWPAKGSAANRAAQEARAEGVRLSRVLEVLRRQPADVIARELPQLLGEYGADPRFTTFAGGLLTNPPAKRHLPVHLTALEVLRRNGDPRASAWLDRIVPASDWGRVYEEGGFVSVKDGFGKSFNRQLERLSKDVEGWPESELLPDERKRLCTAVNRFVATHHLSKQGEGVPDELRDLFELIVKRPRDLARRQVFADRALELGHQDWGEFVSLQLRDADEPLPRLARGRMNALFKKNRAQWLGALDGAVLKRDVVMKNGFPYAVTIGKTTAKKLRESVHARGWRTVEDLTVRTPYAEWMDVIGGTPGFRTLRGDLVGQLGTIAEEFHLRIHTLDLCFQDRQVLGPVAVPPGLNFPRLRVLRLTQRDAAVLQSVQPQLERPLHRLRLEVRARSVAGMPQFVYTPGQAWDWVLKRRTACEGRTELVIQHWETTALEVHLRPKGEDWEIAVGVGQRTAGLDELLERIPGEHVRAVKCLADGDPDWRRELKERWG